MMLMISTIIMTILAVGGGGKSVDERDGGYLRG
jgi:hypothetical protein